MKDGWIPKFVQLVLVALFIGIGFVAGNDAGHPTVTVAQQPMSSGLLPRFISLAPEFATLLNGAVYELNGGGDLSGLVLPGNQVIPRFAVGFSLPPDYAPGTDVVLRVMWGNSRFNAVTCGYRVWVNGVSRFRPGGPPAYPYTLATFPNGQDEMTLVAPDISEQVRATTVTIAGKDFGGNNYFQPGDAISVLLARRADNVNDTCAGKMYVLGLDVTYQGLTAYLPLVMKP
ncbi:MAG: hypothetical protein RBT75_11680 [Anaerolineae bacterium]|nr:hypothetical protein [Anaerolineae bacterium]